MPDRTSESSKRPVSRRDFLAVGGMGVVGLSASERASALKARLGRGPGTVVLIVMNGGASQLETFDPKPSATKEFRGPYRAIETAVPGLILSETLPRLAERAKRFSVIRSLHHHAAPLHETGLQLLQAGALGNRLGPVTALGARMERGHCVEEALSVPAYVVTPARVTLERSLTWAADGRGLDESALDPAVVHDGLLADGTTERMVYGERFDTQPYEIQEQYGHSRFGRLLWNARKLVEYGASWITVNLCDTLPQTVTWDAHGVPAAPATLQDYGRTLCPHLDRALSGFLDDLHDTGLWNDALVVCTGEMGRSPKVNRHGGRDHWTKCWSALVAGGGINGGQVIGVTDAKAQTVIDQPVSVSELMTSVFQTARGSSEASESGSAALASLGLSSGTTASRG